MSIWVCGEVLIDILPTGPVVGGGPANTAKALARLGHDVDFIDGISTDSYGVSARKELERDGVGLSLSLTSDKPTCTATVTLDVSWNASTDNVGVDHYVLQRTVNTSPWITISSNIQTTSYTDTSTSFGTTVCYRVSAVDAAGNASAYSNVGCQTLPQVLNLSVVTAGISTTEGRAGSFDVLNPLNY